MRRAGLVVAAARHWIQSAETEGSEGLDRLPKVISEMVGQTCRFALIPGREWPPFRKLLLANALNHVAEHCVPELWLKPGALGWHDSSRVRNGHQILDAGRK